MNTQICAFSTTHEQTKKRTWKTEFGSSYFDKIGNSVVEALNMLVDTSYHNDELPSFILSERQFGDDRYALRAWVGFDEEDVNKEIFVFSLGLNVNDEYIWNYGPNIEAIFSDITPMCKIESDEMQSNEKNIIKLIEQSQVNFPDVIKNFIESEILKKKFSERFYELWTEAGFGEPDTESSEPWGCPWYWQNNFSLNVENVEQQAEEHFSENREEIESLVKEQ